MKRVLLSLVTVLAVVAPAEAQVTQATQRHHVRVHRITTKIHRLKLQRKLSKMQVEWMAQASAQPERPDLSRRIRSLRTKRAVVRSDLKKLRVIAPHEAWLAKTGSCESMGHTAEGYDLRTGLRAYNGAGFYGRYQFLMHTWRTYGGVGDPRDASWIEQGYRAVLCLLDVGDHAWPVCGH